MKASSINQQGIADQLSLSRTTVSRCFTNHPGINPETRSRVFKLAASLGYTYQKQDRQEKRPNGLVPFRRFDCTDPESYADEDFENPGALLPAFPRLLNFKRPSWTFIS